MARAKEFEACAEKYPYKPPHESFTSLVISERKGSWHGLNLEKLSLLIEEIS